MEETMMKQITILKKLDKELDVLDDQVDELTKEGTYQEIIKRCDAKTKAKIHWASAFGVYTLFYLYLKMNEINPTDHPIKKEIIRLQEFRDRLTESMNSAVNKDKEMTTGIFIDKTAARRTITNYLGNKRNSDYKIKETERIIKQNMI